MKNLSSFLGIRSEFLFHFFRSIRHRGLAVLIAILASGMPNANSTPQQGNQQQTPNEPIELVVQSLVAGPSGTELQRIFQNLAARKDEALPLIRGGLRSDNLWEKLYLTKFLQYCAWPELFPDLLTVALDPGEHWLPRQGALYVLGEIGDARLGLDLLPLLSDPGCPDGIKLVTISTLAKTGYQKASPEIRKLTGHTNVHIRLFAYRALAEFGRPVDQQYLLSALEDQDYIVRQEACGALGAVGGEDSEKTLSIVAEQDRNEAVRSAAQVGLLEGRIRGQRPADRLVTLLDALGKGERRTSTWIIRTILKKCGPAGRDHLRKISRRRDEIGERARAFLIAEEGVIPFELGATGSLASEAPEFHQGFTTHRSLMAFAEAKSAQLSPALSFTTDQRGEMVDGAQDEDGPPPHLPETLDHFYNPLTGAGMTLGAPTHEEILTRWNSMATQFATGNLYGGLNLGAWHYLGRVSHLLQDMSSPLHLFIQAHAPCEFEAFWGDAIPKLETVLTNIGGPLQSSDALPPEATIRLDPFSQERLNYRFANSCPYKYSDDVRGWLEVLAWIMYFRTTFWGEIYFGAYDGTGPASGDMTSATSFSDGEVSPKDNALDAMFDGDIKWVVAWPEHYYEIRDRLDNVFVFMSALETDDWGSCGRNWAFGQQDSSTRVPSEYGNDQEDEHGVRITGRFWFDTRMLGTGSRCYPDNYPNGVAMNDDLDGDGSLDDLHVYFGAHGFPLTVRYNAGLIGLANRRVVVDTSSGSAGFTLSRLDNSGIGAGTNGSELHFVAKSPVNLWAEDQNSEGWPFRYWQKNGVYRSSNQTVTINTNTDWISKTGDTWTAVYALAVPGAPTATSATDVSTTGFQAHWIAVDGATGYRLDVSDREDFATFVSGYQDLAISSYYTYRNVIGLNPGVVYYYRVRAVNSDGASGNSNTIAVTTHLPAPTTVAATSMTASGFTANWGAVSGATGYRLDVSTQYNFVTFVSGYDNLDLGNVTTVGISGLSPGTIYFYRVRAYNAVITSANSNYTSQITCPSAPTATAATDVSSSGFLAHWGSVGGATGYRLDVSADNDFSTFVSGYHDMPTTMTYRVVSGLNGGTVYYYRVRAANDGGFSVYSNSIVVTTHLPVPTTVGATNPTASGFTANWGAVSGATGYRLDVSTQSTFVTFISGYNDLDVGNATTREVSGLSPGTMHFYRVRAYNAVITSGNSNYTPQITCPSAPTAVAATNVSSSGFTANWGAVSGATGYRLDVSTDSDFSTFVSGGQDVYTTYTYRTVSGLNAGTVHYYRVRAINSGGASVNSNTIQTTTDLAAPTTVGATNPTASGFTANWGAVSGATGYRLDVSTQSTFMTFISGYNDLDVGNATTREVSGLSPGTIYYYRVRAYNAVITSGNSNYASQITCPSAPTATAATSVSSSGFTANWGSVGGASGYRLDVSGDSDFSTFLSGYNDLGVGNSTYRVVTGLNSGTAYYYRLRATNVAGPSDNSNTITITTNFGAPTALPPLNVMGSRFTANWTNVVGAIGYRLDVSTSPSFSALVSGYNDLDAGNVTSRVVGGLSPETPYYYRVRAYNGSTMSPNSNTITALTNTLQTGALELTLLPAEAVTAGARWNVDGGEWLESGATVSGLSPESHAVNFNAVAGWIAPSSCNVTIPEGETLQWSRSYVRLSTRVDFNNDGQEDILWRYYGTGGYNYVWFLGDNAEPAQVPLMVTPLTEAVTITVGNIASKTPPLNPLELGGITVTSQAGLPAEVQNVMTAGGKQATTTGMVDDPRRIGGGESGAVPTCLSDARQLATSFDVEVKLSNDEGPMSAPIIVGSGQVLPAEDLSWEIAGTGDFNQDTHVDILWRHYGGAGENVVWLMNGTAGVGALELPPIPDLGWRIVGTGDFNNDAFVDILWRHSGDYGTNFIWYMRGGEVIGGAEIIGVTDQDWKIEGAGDFNKDGYLDILWRYYGPVGFNVIWHLRDGQVIGSAETMAVSDLGWRVGAIGDFNKDGNVDILWRYYGSIGFNYIWYMDQANPVGGGEIIPVSDLNWRIVNR